MGEGIGEIWDMLSVIVDGDCVDLGSYLLKYQSISSPDTTRSSSIRD
jgi:hypothetical protein